jgi:general secretion pathway protein D
MKTNNFKKILGGVLIVLACAAVESHAQQRGGGGGGGGGGVFGGGGFGGFGGGGGNFGGNRNNNSTASSYNNNGSVGSATITVDPQTHNIVVIADEETSLQISNVLANLDSPKPQVLIKVVFLEVQRNNSSDIGVQGSYTGGSLGKSLAQITGYFTNTTITGSGSNAVTATLLSPIYGKSFNMGNNFALPQTLAGASGSGGLYQVLGNDFTATVQAIALAGKSQVLSRPSILARDGQLAKIVVGQEIYLPSGVTYTTSGSTTIPIINGNYTEVGIILNVTPFIGANGLVEMIVQPQTSSVDNSSPGQLIAAGSTLLGTASTPVYAPNLNIRSADTVVVTPSGQTVVIGGLISNSKGSADSKIPFLGDIPLLGQLFKFSNKTETKTELLMFLTPHIVDAPSQLAALAVGETRQSQLITNSVSEQELDRFLERVPVKKK